VHRSSVRCVEINHEDAPEIRPADNGRRYLQPVVCVAPNVGEGLARSPLLLRWMLEALMEEKTNATLPRLEDGSQPIAFTPTRDAGLAQLDRFLPRAGKPYAAQRNYDLGPEQRGNVSNLSPWLRHRLITEEEVLRAVLARHAPSTAEKFVQEVFWRTYFKGWLEQRPSVWHAYKEGVDNALARLESDQDLRHAYQQAVGGQTGIDCFDAWAHELVETGYLHNHARMWFASIWTFTLHLPWELGADFFLRHLMDGDPASNTLGWRWVVGLHTKGKTYLARTENIAKYTKGRFKPEYQLADTAEALTEEVEHPRRPIPPSDRMPAGDYLLVVTEEDGTPETMVGRPPAAVLGLSAMNARSSLPTGKVAQAFTSGGLQDAVARSAGSFAIDSKLGSGAWAEEIQSMAEATGVRSVVTAYAPVGPAAAELADAGAALETAGMSLHQIRRQYDDIAWPHATRGFFALKKNIPEILRGLELAAKGIEN